MTALAGYYGHADYGPYSGLQRGSSEVCCCGARPLLELGHGRKRAIACVLTAMQRSVGGLGGRRTSASGLLSTGVRGDAERCSRGRR